MKINIFKFFFINFSAPVSLEMISELRNYGICFSHNRANYYNNYHHYQTETECAISFYYF